MGSKYPGTAEFGKLLFDHDTKLSMSFLRGHLLLEQALAVLIELHTERPAVMLDRASFSSKLNICDGLGLLDADSASAVRAVNRERNHLAHRLDATLTLTRVQALVDKLPLRVRRGVESVVSATPHAQVHHDEDALVTETLMAIFLVLGMRLGNLIQQGRYEAQYASELESYRMARAIAEIQETGVSAETIRSRLALPHPPDPLQALTELFPREN
ncbi:hypothetical protein QYR02_01385 [Microbacterium maritypicum]|uniref:hypothetical protein n=1 Tax=Microbacterium maritypicum TaxID=33918 RepID=UPI002672405D|nr:hypothetical protein [Microbacterium liquefaciens]WKT89592.1 hypothetical protein QYR02_01385 [Microbacterium liquefaciens]